MDQSNYKVLFEDYTERHYIKPFKKKYKSSWDVTRQDIIDVCKRIDQVVQIKRADIIATKEQHKLVKLDFAIDGSRLSPKSSGNRCILHVDEDQKLVRILIVYSKNDISSPNETAKWKSMVKENFKDTGILFSL